jgi:hypothetical protein
MNQPLPSLEECLLVAGGLFKKKHLFSIEAFRFECILNRKKREQKLLDMLEQYYIGVRIHRAIHIIHEQSVTGDAILRQHVIEQTMLQINAFCLKTMVSRDPRYFRSEDYRVGVFLVAARIYELARLTYPYL